MATGTDTSIVDPYAYNDMDELIADTSRLIAQKMNDFQTWLVENPQSSPQDITLQSRRHEIKLLNIRLAEYKNMKLAYDSTQVPQQPPNSETVYSKQRTNDPVFDLSGPKVVSRRPVMKISRT